MIQSKQVPSWLEVPGLIHQSLSVRGKERSQRRDETWDGGIRMEEPAMSSRHLWAGQFGSASPLKVDLRHQFFYSGPSPQCRPLRSLS